MQGIKKAIELRGILKIGVIDVIVAIVVAAVMLFSLLGSRTLPILLMLVACYIIPCCIYRHQSFYNKIGQLSLSVAFIAMSIFYALNMWQYTVQYGSVDSPYLLHDAQSFYLLSHDIADGVMGEDSPIMPYWGYPFFLSLWIKAGINDIAYPIAFNIFLMLCAIILVGRCTLYLLEKSEGAVQVASYAMLICAMIPGVLAPATDLSKEPFVATSMLACICSLLAFKQGNRGGVLYIILFIVGLVVLSFCRTTYIYILGLFFVAIWIYRFAMSEIASFLIIALSMAVAIFMGSSNSWWGDNSYIVDYVSSNSHTTFFSGESQAPLQELLGPYSTYPLYIKVLLWPITIAIQFLIPFPFETVPTEMGMPLSTTYQRMSYLWYLGALPVIVFCLFYWFRKGVNRKLSLWAIASVLAYCIPALITGGSISRYAFCLVPMLTIMGGYVVWDILQQGKLDRKVLVFAVIYVVLISLALLVGANPHLIL